jgi:glycosyltransferase involved in cell wall biosynthesis
LYAHLSPHHAVRIAPISGFGVEPGLLPGTRWSDELEGVLALLERERPAVVVSFGWAPTVTVACRLAGVPMISYVLVPLMSLPPALSASMSRGALLPHTTRLVVPSRWYERVMTRALRPPPGRVMTIPNGLDLQVFDADRFDRAAARRDFGLPDAGPIIVTAGFLYPTKRPELAIDVLAEVRRVHPGALLLFAGIERVLGYKRMLLERADRLGVGDAVRHLGFVPNEEMPRVYAAADLYLHCGVSETFGLVLAEAMAMRRPVVAFARWGPTDIVAHGETGLLVQPEEGAPGLAAAVLDILGSPERTAQMGEAALKRARKEYDIRATVARLARCVEDLLGSNGTATP